MAKTNWFSKAATGVSRFTGGALCFALTLGLVLAWAITGPLFGSADGTPQVPLDGLPASVRAAK